MTDEIVDGLAVYRLTRLATTDTFPPVQRARFALLSRFDEKSWQFDLATCDWCASFWIALGVVAVRRTRLWRAVAPVLAASALTGLLSDR